MHNLQEEDPSQKDDDLGCGQQLTGRLRLGASGRGDGQLIMAGQTGNGCGDGDCSTAYGDGLGF